MTFFPLQFTQLFDKVEQQSVESKNKQNILQRNAAVTIQKHWYVKQHDIKV